MGNPQPQPEQEREQPPPIGRKAPCRREPIASPHMITERAIGDHVVEIDQALVDDLRERRGGVAADAGEQRHVLVAEDPQGTRLSHAVTTIPDAGDRNADIGRRRPDSRGSGQ